MYYDFTISQFFNKNYHIFIYKLFFYYSVLLKCYEKKNLIVNTSSLTFRICSDPVFFSRSVVARDANL